MSSFTFKSHSWTDLDKLFTKLRFVFIEERKGFRYYQDPDGSWQTLQHNEKLDKPYIEDKLSHIGLSYKVFRWLIVE